MSALWGWRWTPGRASTWPGEKPTRRSVDIRDALAETEFPLWLFHQAQAFDQAGQHNEAAGALQKALHLPHGLTKEMLHPLELASFEKLSRLGPPAHSSGAIGEGTVEASSRLGKGP